jgi:isoamylase
MRRVVTVGLCLLLIVVSFRADKEPLAAPLSVKPTTEKNYGAHIDPQGWVHFVVYAPAAQEVNLLLFKTQDAQDPSNLIPMKKVGDDWKIRVKGPGIGHSTLYLYQAKGPRTVSSRQPYGPSFNEHYYLNDPYAYQTQNVNYPAFFRSSPLIDSQTVTYAGGGKSLVYDHSRDAPSNHVEIKREDLIVYELHVQDYTARIAGLDPAKRGTYLGLVQRDLKTSGRLSAGLDHLVELGVNAVELMPVMEFDEMTGNEEGRLNHWGYMTTNFFAPEARYASVPGQQVAEFKQLIHALHDRGIAVFLDTVYNHTGEQSPWTDGDGRLNAKYYNFRGLANTQVYRSTSDGKFYFNNTGTGNDVGFVGGDRFTKRLVRDSLALWYRTYGIDGFRFDLARILADGSQDAADWVDNDPRYAKAHLHAEPWDLGGQWWDFMDNFSWSYANNRWAKWLGKYRDHIRRFSASGLKNCTAFKQLIEGYGSVGEGIAAPASTKPWRSVNFLAVHDGYTLRDCVFFNDNDGSHNCWDSDGNEGLRREREKLLLGILLTSQGVPLLLQGDEFGLTKAGATSQAEVHNTYNYESTTGDVTVNHVNWVDWRLKDGDNSESPWGPTYGRELFAWTKNLIALRKQWRHFRRADFAPYVHEAWNGGKNAGASNDAKFSYAWEGHGDGEPTQLAVIWWGRKGEPDLMVIYNEHWQELTVNNIKDWSQGDWKMLARSWMTGDQDFCDVKGWQTCEAVGDGVTLKGRSMVILISDND